MLCDIDPVTFNLDFNGARSLLEAQQPIPIKALLPVHLYGQCAPWTEFEALRKQYSVALIEDGHRPAGDILVDQGEADGFLAEQLRPELLRAAADKAGIALTLRLQPGYDHSYNFISTFMEDHIRWHAARL